MISWKSLMEKSNSSIKSYQVMEEMFIYQQISDTIFEKTNYTVKEGEVFDGEIVYKKNNQIYLNIGYDEKLGIEVFLQIISENGEFIIRPTNS